MNKKGLTTKQLNELLKKWQKKLLLNEWKLSIKIVEFKRKDFKQSGDIKIFRRDKKAVVLLTNEPFRDEEGVLLHELVHLILWEYDIFCEKLALANSPGKMRGNHNKYMGKLEDTVATLTNILLRNGQ